MFICKDSWEGLKFKGLLEPYRVSDYSLGSVAVDMAVGVAVAVAVAVTVDVAVDVTVDVVASCSPATHLSV